MADTTPSMEPVTAVIARLRKAIDAAKIRDGEFAPTCTVNTNDLVVMVGLVMHGGGNLNAGVAVAVKPPGERN
jgi:hypothetical protein